MNKDSSYWAFIYRPAIKTDLGHVCKECKKPFNKIME